MFEGSVTTSQLADELGVSRETATRWVQEGRLPGAFLYRGRWHIPVEEAEAFAEDYEQARAIDDEEADDSYDDEIQEDDFPEDGEDDED